MRKLNILIVVLLIFNSCATYHGKGLQIVKNTGAKIVIDDYSPSAPNSAGGRDAIIYWTNTTNKTIKYIWFHVTAYNAVDDIVVCSIKQKTSTSLQLTGPIEHGKGGSGIVAGESRWSNVWYNWDIRRMKITKIDIEFIDGSKSTLGPDEFYIVRERTLRM